MKLEQARLGKGVSGFTLIEVMVAMVVLIVGILTLYTMQVSAVRGNMHANKLTEASTWNADRLEKMVSLNYNTSPFLNDVDFDGTGQDADKNGIDDDGGNFGLDDMTSATADGVTTSPDGRYTLFWNIAVDVPMPNLKTVRVLVQDNTNVLSAPVVFTYIKADII